MRRAAPSRRWPRRTFFTALFKLPYAPRTCPNCSTLALLSIRGSGLFSGMRRICETGHSRASKMAVYGTEITSIISAGSA
jgi:hypothetical protein